MKETIEEACKNTIKKYLNEREKQTAYLEFIEGAKWQQERMYSEEDMLNFAWWLHKNIGQYTDDKTAHFEGLYFDKYLKH